MVTYRTGEVEGFLVFYREARASQQMGLAWFIRDVAGVRLLSHGGGELTEEVAARVLERYLGIREPAPIPLVRMLEELAAYTGRYTSTLQTLGLDVRDGALLLHMTPTDALPGEDRPSSAPPSPLAFCDEDEVVAGGGSAQKRARGVSAASRWSHRLAAPGRAAAYARVALQRSSNATTRPGGM